MKAQQHLFRNVIVGAAIGLLSYAGPTMAAKKLAVKTDIIAQKISFENKSDLLSWQPTKGTVTLSGNHQKDGRRSMLWQWKRKDDLVVSNLSGLQRAVSEYKGGQPEKFEPAFYKKGMYGGIKLWIYQDQAHKGEILCSLGDGKKGAKKNPKYRFKLNLDFTGWRAVWVQFEEDAKVSDYKGDGKVNTLVFSPQNGESKGKLYIDHVQLMDFVSYKRHSDMIFQNKKKAVRSDTYEIYSAYQKYLALDQDKGGAIDATSFKKVEDRLEYLILGDQKQDWKRRYGKIKKSLDSKVNAANKFYEKLNIRESKGHIQGTSLFTCRDEQGEKNGYNYQRVIESTLFPLAFDYRYTQNNDSKEKVLKIYRYLADQGWAAGSAAGTLDHVIRLNGFAVSAFLMRNELSEKQRDEIQACLAWHTRIGNILDLDLSQGENTDLVRGGALPKLISILLMKDGARKQRLMEDYITYLEHVSSVSPGYADTFKPDLSVYHHRGTYLNSYGIQTLNTVSMLGWLMDDTSFALAEDRKEFIKKVLYRQSDIAYGIYLNMGVCGRFPYKNTALDRYLISAYAFMSMQDQKVKDPKLAARFNEIYSLSKPTEVFGMLFPQLTYSGTLGTLSLLSLAHQQMGDKFLAREGQNISMPFSSLSVQRRNNWFFAVKGYNAYVWDYETGHKGENNLGRYLSFGSILALKGDPRNAMNRAGIDQNKGFHWAYLPGATTKALPIEKVYHVNKPTSKYKEGYHRSFAQTTFASGLSAQGKNGIYAMELRDDVGPDKDKSLFDDSFRARKSYFFFDDQIVCLGSNITNNDARYSTITTLFQTNLQGKELSEALPWVNGKQVAQKMPSQNSFQGAVISDIQDIQYVVAKDSDPVVVDYSDQKSLQNVKGKYNPITTPHAKAWIDHGKAPKNGKYCYTMLMNQTKKEAATYAQNVPYQIMEQDKVAHIVYHKTKGTYAFVIFDQNKYTAHGKLISVNRPLMAYLQETPNRMMLTVANPDANLAKWNHNMSFMPNSIVHANATAQMVELKLEGKWKLEGVSDEVISMTFDNEGNTVIKLLTKNAKSIDIPLHRYNIKW